MIDLKIVDFTPLDTRIALVGHFAEDMRPQMQEIGQMLLESNLSALDAGGRPAAFAATRSGRLPLGGRGGRIGQSEHILSVTNNSVTLEAGGTPFNAIHQLGGQTHPTVTERSKKFYWAMFFKTGNQMWKYMALQKIGKRMNVNIPARRYFRIQDEDVVKAKEILAGAITK